MKKFSVKQKLKAFLAAALCVCMAASPLTAFAESLPEQEESILPAPVNFLQKQSADWLPYRHIMLQPGTLLTSVLR